MDEENDWDGMDDVPSRPRTRLRVLAVMGAAVLGCGVAAVVTLLPDDAPRRVSGPDRTSEPSYRELPNGGGHTYLVPNEGESGRTTASQPTESSSDTGSPTESSGTGPGSETGGANPVDHATSDSTPPPSHGNTTTTPERTSEPPNSDPPDSPPPTTSDDDGNDRDDEDDGCWLFC